MIPILTFLASASLVCLLCFPLRGALLWLDLIDFPNGRSSHGIPTPRGGGIAIILVVCVGLCVSGSFGGNPLAYVLAGVALALAMVSLRDDFRPLSARARFAAHCAAALVLLGALWSEIEPLPFGSGFSFSIFLFGSFFWLVGYTNAFNFMDGINGIAAGQACITGLGTAAIASSAAQAPGLVILPVLVAGCSFGFLPHNFPRARMFMGDVGSAPLGFLLAALAVAVVAQFGWQFSVPLLLLHANYILDTSITLIRRFFRGEPIYEAHKEHFYQRLVRAGKSHAFITCWEMLLQGLSLACAFLYLNSTYPARVGIIGFVVAVWFGFFFYSEYIFRCRNTPDANGHPARSRCRT